MRLSVVAGFESKPVDWITPMSRRVETVFLDAGNTLISMDYEWIARELERAGLVATASALERAEAGARPATSDFLAAAPPGPDANAFEFHLLGMLERLPAAAGLARERRHEIALEIAPRLRAPGQDFRLWSRVLPGVREALSALRALGLDLIVVSNSDGSVERALRGLGLTEHLSAVHDSAIVGHEKPDPRFFRHALAASGADPAKTVHVGDMYYQDVGGARSAGIDAVLLDPFEDWVHADCYRARDLRQFALRLAAARENNSEIVE